MKRQTDPPTVAVASPSYLPREVGRTMIGSGCSVLFKGDVIPALKNRESIHFDFLLRGFVEKESIHDS